jgi:hypothetical protein
MCSNFDGSTLKTNYSGIYLELRKVTETGNTEYYIIIVFVVYNSPSIFRVVKLK